jgi:putative glutamine amidotransferase
MGGDLMPVIYIAGDFEKFAAYWRAVQAAGGQMGTNPSESDALLLPGGGDVEPWRYGQQNTASRDLEPERDTSDLALLERFTGQGKPVLGICRGLQAINVFFGGTLLQDIEGHSTINGVDRRHAVRTDLRSPLAFCGDTINSAHHQAVDRLGNGLYAAQWASDGVVEALCHQTLPVWAVQWHPERFWEPWGGQVFGRFLELC